MLKPVISKSKSRSMALRILSCSPSTCSSHLAVSANRLWAITKAIRCGAVRWLTRMVGNSVQANCLRAANCSSPARMTPAASTSSGRFNPKASMCFANCLMRGLEHCRSAIGLLRISFPSRYSTTMRLGRAGKGLDSNMRYSLNNTPREGRSSRFVA